MLSETSKELIGMLRAVRDDKNFIVGVMSNANSEDARETIIRYIKTANDRHEAVTPDDMVALSVILSEQHRF